MASTTLFSGIFLLFICLRGNATPRRIQSVSDIASTYCPSSLTGPQRETLSAKVKQALLCNMGACEENPALSCQDMFSNSSVTTSGHYWLKRCDGSAYRAYCTSSTPCSCSGSIPGWKRIAFLNTTDSSQPCPGGTKLFSESLPIRTCARKTHGCLSLVYSTNYMPYQRVCGRVIGYQHRSPDAFSPYYEDRTKTIDENYMDGVSITYGYFPRKHIWTFTAGLDETRTDFRRCPCANRNQQYNGVIPPFIGSDYFCETGSRTAVGAGFYPNDPLWDGQGCGAVSTCCTGTTAPWFCRTLPTATRENVEVRLCGDEDNNNENIPIQLIELYVQ